MALHTGVSATTVHRIIARYNRLGPAVIEQSAKGGRHHEYLTLEQEQAFLQPFFARAQRGEMATVEQIQQAFEGHVQQEVHVNTIYRLLHRHGWRKLAPRSRQRKRKSGRTRGVSKKNFQQEIQAALSTREPTDERPVLKMAEDEGCGWLA
jgi:transposase